ncbi:MAG: isopentenyl phosphate kinase [Microgenomates group bacterium]
MRELLLIKLGGSLITDKSKEFAARPGVILRLAKEIKVAQKSFPGKIILAHGSGSFGHSVAAKYRTKEGMVNKQSLIGLPLVADAAIRINRIVIEELLRAGLPAVSFAPASLFLAGNGELKETNPQPIFRALDLGFLPVLYGDIIFDEKRGFCIFSSETVLGILANQAKNAFDVIRLIYCGNTDGVYDANGKTIPEITPRTYQKIKRFITGSGQTDVTGGMLHKVKESLLQAQQGIVTNIISGNRPNELRRAILGQKISGTTIRS